MVDLAVTFLGGLLCGSFLRRALFRIEFPFLELALEGSTFSARWIKSMVAYTAAGVVTYISTTSSTKICWIARWRFFWTASAGRGSGVGMTRALSRPHEQLMIAPLITVNSSLPLITVNSCQVLMGYST